MLLARLEPEQIINLLSSIDNQGFSAIHYVVEEGLFEVFEGFIKKLNDEEIFILFDEIKKSLLDTDISGLDSAGEPKAIFNPDKKMPFKFCMVENLEKFEKILDAKNLKLDTNLEVVFSVKRSAQQDESPSSSARNTRARRSVLSLMR